MITLRRSVLPMLVAAFAFVISYVILALDFRIGEYRLQSDRSTIQQEQSLSPLYRANINKRGASQANENDINNTQLFLFQIKHELHLENEPDNTLSYYNPALTNDALLIFNSVLVPNQNKVESKYSVPVYQPKQAIIDIPRNFILPNDNILDVLIQKSENFRGLNREYLGPKSDIEKAVRTQIFIESWFPTITLSLCLSLIFISLFGFLFSNARMTYLIGISYACLLCIQCIATGNTPLSIFIQSQHWVGIASPLLFLCLLIGYWFLIKSSVPRVTSIGLGLLLYATTGPILFLLSKSINPDFLEVIFASQLLLISALPFLVYIIISRSAFDLAAYGKNISTLKRTIGKQRKELDEKSKIIAEEMKQRAILEERQRVMRDIHDGIGGQLLSLLLRVRTGSLQQTDVAKEIQSSLTDLRLIVDSVDHFGGDFATALATFRSRAEQQMSAAGIRLSWFHSKDVMDRQMSPGQTLQLYRFMQEALTNIVRHSKATQASISINLNSETGNTDIIIEDGGVGIAQTDTLRAGKGLRNLEVRAQKLKAKYAIGPGETGSGTRVSLSIPPDTSSQKE
ncbi:MAG: ATP-binding protein [Litorimonas sp.]